MGVIHLFDRAINFTIESITVDTYRLGTKEIENATQVVFSTPLSHANYDVEVLSYISDDNVLVDYG
jgi:hypothetical protein